MAFERVEPRERLALWQRALIPTDWYDARHGRSTSDWVVDTVVFVVATAFGAITLAYLWHGHGGVVNGLQVACGTLACLALWVRRSRPVTVALLATAASAFSALAAGAALVAIFNAAMRARSRALVAVAVMALTASAVFPFVNPAAGTVLKQRFPGFMATALAFGWGFFVRARRELVISLRERAEQLEADQQRNAEFAREVERQRIAREMHDTLAHRLSLLSVHAGALEFRPDASSEDIAQAAAVIRASASAALDELRHVITVFREDTASTDPPQPTLAQLSTLLQESRDAGMHLHLHLEIPEDDSLPPAVARTAYRVIQEGLTNSRKHAPDAPVDLTVAGDRDGGLTIEVISRSPGANGVASAATPGSARYGLIGLAERVGLVGGQLKHGATADGDFVLRATLPGHS